MVMNQLQGKTWSVTELYSELHYCVIYGLIQATALKPHGMDHLVRTGGGS